MPCFCLFLYLAKKLSLNLCMILSFFYLTLCLHPSSKRDLKAAIKIRVRLRVGIVKGTDAYELKLELPYEFFRPLRLVVVNKCLIGDEFRPWRCRA